MSIVRKIADLPRAAVVAAGDQFTIWRNGRTYQADLSLILTYIGLVAKGDKGDRGEKGDQGIQGNPGIKGDTGATTANFDTTPLAATGTPTPRLLPDREADFVNVKNFGARLDGTDDTVAFNLARGAVPRHGTAEVPAGQYNLQSVPTSGSLFPILWKLTGNSFGSGTVPVEGIGGDVIESFLGEQGGKWFSKQQTNPDEQGVVRIDHKVTHTGGTDGATIPTLQVNTIVPAGPPLLNYVWANRNVMTISATGPGQHVALATTTLRPADALADGRGPRSVMWPFYIEARDKTGQPANISGPMVLAEMDMVGNGDDPAPGQRILAHFIIAKDDQALAPMRVAQGVVIGTNDAGPTASKSRMGVGFQLQTPFDIAAFDTVPATSIGDAPAFRMASGQRIAFDGIGANTFGYTRSMYYDSGQLTYRTQNGPVFQIGDGGELAAFGSVTTPILNIPDVTAPTGTSDPSGNLYDVRFNSQYIYRKTSSGWLRYPVGSTF